MSFFSRLFKKRSAPAKQAQQEKHADQNVPARSSAETLTEIRQQARTGDPTLNGRHHSGSF